VQRDKKRDAFSLVLSDLGQPAQGLRQRIQREAGIWVLGEGEIETYFGLSASAKGDYVAVSRRVRNGEVRIHPEVEDAMRWGASMQDDGAG